ncbi:paraquat-inducible protein A [Chryseosolibacter indicus]|uniref:Paraquat-inducible protein A n=1 Tax=Chryseosolibacter indicus TaxID=2782351 RepID=A0ABS5VXL6_9BACT|nr:paraquat-inducible protein A [Chryseosolibacter indicus]MBT1704731.1 paraquat-inducible protein A [Chryseosolibacter indicus]
MKHFKTIILIVLVVIITFLSFSIYQIENERRILKEDLIELSKVKYGLFNIDEWKKILATIITKKVDELNFTNENRKQMKEKISSFLYKIIDDFEARYNKEKSRTLKGMFERSFTSFFGAFNTIRKDVPQFTDQIIAFLNDKQNRKAVRGYIIEKLNEYADNTFDKIDYTTVNTILARHQYTTRDEAITGLVSRIDDLDLRSKPYKISILIIALTAIVWVFISKAFSKSQYVLLILISLLLLVTGLLLPMIEIDARISSMSFTLLGETISFKDQVLYYKSKSILEVVSLMLLQSRIDVLIVGVLVLIFSVLFPVLKQMASVLFVYNNHARTSKIVRFMVFKTGKWSMADVMVIAIFMSYIGFSGIITEQLKQIQSMTNSLEILTTNKSSLLTGFFFFTAFAIFSLSISQKIDLQFNTSKV